VALKGSAMSKYTEWGNSDKVREKGGRGSSSFGFKYMDGPIEGRIQLT
jgi:hypothetical protein